MVVIISTFFYIVQLKNWKAPTVLCWFNHSYLYYRGDMQYEGFKFIFRFIPIAFIASSSHFPYCIAENLGWFEFCYSVRMIQHICSNFIPPPLKIGIILKSLQFICSFFIELFPHVFLQTYFFNQMLAISGVYSFSIKCNCNVSTKTLPSLLLTYSMLAFDQCNGVGVAFYPLSQQVHLRLSAV